MSFTRAFSHSKTKASIFGAKPDFIQFELWLCVNKMYKTKQNFEVTPRRWSAPHHLDAVTFKLETAHECSNENLDPDVTKDLTVDTSDQPDCENADSQKFISCLETYCSEIIKTRRENFVDLQGFKEKEFSVTIEELDEAKRNAEKIAKVSDHAGIGSVHVSNAIGAGVLAFAESRVLTRNRTNTLKNASNLQTNDILYNGLPETSTRKFAKKIRIERDSRIVETFVDFKTELKTKHDVLKRVETVNNLDKLRELPESKRLRNHENLKNLKKRPCSSNIVDFKTPPSALKRKYDPLDYNNIMDDFLDEQARGFVEENQLLAKRCKKLASTNSPN